MYFFKNGGAYGEIKTDYDFYMVWTSPIDGYVKTDIFGETRWGKTFYTDFSVMHNNIVIDSISTLNKSEYKVYNMTVLVENKNKIIEKINSAIGVSFGLQ